MNESNLTHNTQETNQGDENDNIKSVITGIRDLDELWEDIKDDSSLLIEGIKDVRTLVMQICRNHVNEQIENQRNCKKTTPCLLITLDDNKEKLIKYAKEALDWKEESISAGYFKIITDNFKFEGKNETHYWDSPEYFLEGIQKLHMSMLREKNQEKNQNYEPREGVGDNTKLQIDGGIIVFYSLNSFFERKTANGKIWNKKDVMENLFKFNEINGLKSLLIYTYAREIEKYKETHERDRPTYSDKKVYDRLYYDMCHSSLRFKDMDVFNDGRMQNFIQLTNVHSSIDSFWIPYFFVKGKGIVSYNDINEDFFGIKPSEAIKKIEIIEDITEKKKALKDFLDERFGELKKDIISSYNLKYSEGKKKDVYSDENDQIKSLSLDFKWQFDFPKLGKGLEPLKIGLNRLVSIISPWCPWDNYWIVCNLVYSALRECYPILYLSIDDNPDNLIYNWANFFERIDINEIDITDNEKNISLNKVNDDTDLINLINREGDGLKNRESKLTLALLNYINATGGESFLINPKEFVRNDLKLLITTGEDLPRGLRDELEDKWNTTISATYASSEAVIGMECQKHDGYHFWADMLLLEALDEDNNPVGDGEKGEIALTPLFGETLPLIRYKLGDLVRISWERCPCRLDYPRVWFEGRLKNSFVLASAINVFHFQIKKVMETIPFNLLRYQITINDGPDDIDYLEITLEANKTDEKSKEVVKQAFERLSIDFEDGIVHKFINFDIKLVNPGYLTRNEKSQKQKQFIIDNRRFKR